MPGTKKLKKQETARPGLAWGALPKQTPPKATVDVAVEDHGDAGGGLLGNMRKFNKQQTYKEDQIAQAEDTRALEEEKSVRAHVATLELRFQAAAGEERSEELADLEAEREAAAMKIQALHRGRAARTEIERLKKSGVKGAALESQMKLAAEAGNEAEAATLQLQASERRREARKEFAASGGDSKASERLAAELAFADAEMELAATKIQAVQRGRVARQKVETLKADGQGESTEVGTLEAEQQIAQAEFEAATLKIQAMQRGRVARQDAERLRFMKNMGDDMFDEEAEKRLEVAERNIERCEVVEEMAVQKLERIQHHGIALAAPQPVADLVEGEQQTEAHRVAKPAPPTRDAKTADAQPAHARPPGGAGVAATTNANAAGARPAPHDGALAEGSSQANGTIKQSKDAGKNAAPVRPDGSAADGSQAGKIATPAKQSKQAQEDKDAAAAMEQSSCQCMIL